MALNYIWVAFFLIAFVVSLVKLIFFGDYEVFPKLLESTFSSAKTGFELSIGLTGVMALWLGLMKIGEKGGIVQIFSKVIGPFFSRLFPDVPRNHPAIGAMIMNFSANLLGLDNAATPLGLKAMKELQTLNPSEDTASNAQIMFLVLHASGLTIIPLSVIADRATMGAANPTATFIPTLIATFGATVAALIYVSVRQKINLFDRVVMLYLVVISSLIGLIVWYFSTLSPEELTRQSTFFTSVIIISVITSFIVLGLMKRISMFETFIEGAKEGFEVAVKIIPFLIAILVAIGLFKTCGALDYLSSGIGWLLGLAGINTDFVPALPVAFLKPLSGQAARAMMISISEGDPNSFVASVASIFRGCAETTFYITALYFGSINIRNTRYAITGGLVGDLAGVIVAIFVGYMFFH